MKIRNIGDAQAEDIKVSMNQWTSTPVSIDIMLPGDERDIGFDL